MVEKINRERERFTVLSFDMEELCGGGGRRSLWDEMSAAPRQGDSLAGLTLDAVLNNRKQGGSRTLLDIIKEDPTRKTDLSNKDRKSWKLFRDKLRLKRAGAAWTSSVRIPASDLPIDNRRRSAIMSDEDANGSSPPRSVPPMFLRRGSTRFTPSAEEGADNSRSGDFLPTRSFKPHGSPRLSNRDGEEINADPFEVAREGTRRLAAALNDERGMSAREAIAAQEAAAAQHADDDSEGSPTEKEDEEEHHEEEEGEGGSPAGGGPAAEASEAGQPAVRMSLMDLLEETDREMGVEGSKYIMGEDEDEEEFDEEEEEEEDPAAGTEYTCCVCMVRHKGAAFIPCGHTFCRLCSKELYVQRGHCPLCNNFIVEILDIF